MNSAKLDGIGRHRHLEDSDDSDEEAQGSVLTTAKADEHRPKPYRLVARNKNYSSLEDMSTFQQLDYVDLTGNSLTSIQGLANNTRLKTVILKSNKLSDLTPLLGLQNVQVLDVSDNQFVTTEWLVRAKFAPGLLALVMKGNRIPALEGLGSCEKLTSIVVSDNQIEDLSPLCGLRSLTKISASKNEIRVIPESIGNLSSLRELRLAHNRVSQLPSKETLTRLSALNIFDMGNNRVTSLDNLSACSALTQVNVRNNPMSLQDEDLRAHIQEICSTIEIIDGKRFTGGRRKLRINRMRLEAGFPLEPDRRFARPPKPYPGALIPSNDNDALYLNDRLNEDNQMPRKKRKYNENGRYNDNGQVERKKNAPTPKAKVLSDAEEDEVINPEEFEQMAKKKSISGASLHQTSSALLSTSGDTFKKKRKRKRAKNRESGAVVTFGAGGQSKW